ncbi:hypothetical protein CFP56_031083 [Quercus suber]|uniref:S-protein homolog n=1 Tax=Quercus suber TaxID=58331 RepID=A0AAW0LVR1_QUESU
MTCLSLATRNRIKKRQLVLIVMFWLNMLHISKYCVRKISLKAAYGHDFHLRKGEFHYLYYESDPITHIEWSGWRTNLANEIYGINYTNFQDPSKRKWIPGKNKMLEKGKEQFKVVKIIW